MESRLFGGSAAAFALRRRAKTGKMRDFEIAGFIPMLTFQQIILTLQSYWDKQGCALLQPYDMEVGAGT